MSKSQRFYINVWDDCNLNCKHCFNEGGKSQDKLLSAAEILSIIEEAQSLQEIKEVQLTGGEPTQRPDIFTIINDLLKKEFKILLQTNGCFNNEIAEEILKLPEELVTLIISLDGIETNEFLRGKHSTKKVIDNIKKLYKKFGIRINTLLSSKITWMEIEKLALMAQKYDLTLAFNPVCPAGRADFSLLMTRNKYFEYMYRLEKFRNEGIRIRKCFDFINNHMVENENCPVRSGISIHIAADGSVSPCGFLVNNPDCYLGSIRDFSIVEFKERYPSYLSNLASECYDCELYQKEYCHGGCPARIHAIYKKFDEVDIYCMAKYFQTKVNE